MASPEGLSRKVVTLMLIAAVSIVAIAIMLVRSRGDDDLPDKPIVIADEEDTSSRANSPAMRPKARVDASAGGKSGAEPPAKSNPPLLDPEDLSRGKAPEEIRRAFEEAATAEIPEEIFDALEQTMDPPPEHIRQQYEMIGRRAVPPQIRAQFENPYPELPEELSRSLTVDTTKGTKSEGE